jgi:hypothetical protein
LVILGVETPGRQGVKPQEYLDIPEFCNGSRAGCIGVQNGKLFLSEPLDRQKIERVNWLYA